MKRYRMLIFAFLLAALAVAAYALGMYRQPGAEKKQQPGKAPLEFYQQREEAMTGFTAVIEQFAKIRPDIELYQRNIPNAQELLVARIRGGDVPDLFTEWPTQRNFSANVAQGMVVDLSQQPFLRNVSPRALDMARGKDGHIYALPLNYNCMEVYYNTEIFKALGLAPPQTVAELLAVCDALEARGILPMVFCIRDYGRLSHVAQMMLAAMVDDYLDELEALAAGRISPEAREKMLQAFRLFRTLYGYSQGQGEAAYSYYEACEQFAKGGAAMFISGSYALNTILSFETDIQADVFPFPGETVEKRVILSSIDTAICVSSASPHREEALAFLKYLADPQASTLYASLDLAPSCIPGVSQGNPITRSMSGHIESYENADWLKSRFSLETATLFGDAAGTYVISGDEAALWSALEAAF